mmetsp:Transcript_57710/g.118041  ORF Transcript_57710/g.118041 Transcript_57710/m.118041 type:complete len:80 (-) Transcript_57710:1279-1518(-)
MKSASYLELEPQLDYYLFPYGLQCVIFLICKRAQSWFSTFVVAASQCVSTWSPNLVSFLSVCSLGCSLLGVFTLSSSHL